MSAWLVFAAASAVIVIAARRLAVDGETIALRTGLGDRFVGTMLLALATSLPELLTTIVSLGAGEPSLAVGGLFGSCMFNMAMLGMLDILHRRGNILSRVALGHALGAGLASLSLAVACFFLLADLETKVGWLGLDSLAILAVYLGAVWLLRGQGPSAGRGGPEPSARRGLPRALAGFGLGTLALLVATPFLVDAAVDIAALTGLGTGFIGVTLVAVVTSLPEAVTTIAAARIGALDMAVGNLFGSNLFNVFALALADLFYLSGRLLGDVEPAMTLAALLALVLTALAMVTTTARIERRILGVEVDALLLLLIYAAGMAFLYQRGLVG